MQKENVFLWLTITNIVTLKLKIKRGLYTKFQFILLWEFVHNPTKLKAQLGSLLKYINFNYYKCALSYKLRRCRCKFSRF